MRTSWEGFPFEGDSDMAMVDEKLRTLCAEAPDELHNVVITLKKPKDQIQLERLGLADAEPIPYQDYMLRSVVPGSKILDLQKETDIEEVTEDSDFEAH